jgi:hypothetical protein
MGTVAQNSGLIMQAAWKVEKKKRGTNPVDRLFFGKWRYLFLFFKNLPDC